MDKRLLDPRFNPTVCANDGASLTLEQYEKYASQYYSLFDVYAAAAIPTAPQMDGKESSISSGLSNWLIMPTTPSQRAEHACAHAIALLEQRAKLFGVEVGT